MLNKKQLYGKKSEAIVVKHLKKHGYKIHEQNYRTKYGEIDIIAEDDRALVFVEVKARKTLRYGNPKWALTPAKQRKISMAALFYLKHTGQSNAKARFDVVTVTSAKGNDKIEIIKNAFNLAYL